LLIGFCAEGGLEPTREGELLHLVALRGLALVCECCVFEDPGEGVFGLDEVIVAEDVLPACVLFFIEHEGDDSLGYFALSIGLPF
jgi:hypothetical protein